MKYEEITDSDSISTVYSAKLINYCELILGKLWEIQETMIYNDYVAATWVFS